MAKHESSKGGSSQPGRPFDPLSIDPDEQKPPPPTAIPIGRPLSDEEYRKMKEQAATRPPLSKPKQDP